MAQGVANRERPKAGAALLSAEWFLNVGLQADPAAAAEADLRRVRAALEPHFDLVDPGPISSRGQAERAARLFRAEGVELLILVHVQWSEDGPLVRLLRELADLPVLVWCYNPYPALPARMTPGELFRASGAVGFLQGSVPLARMGVKFGYVFGHPEDPRLAAELAEYARVFAARAALRALRIGRVGPRSECMTGSWTDEFRLLARLGVSLVPVSAWRLAEEAEAIGEPAVLGFVRELKSRYPVRGVSDRSLQTAARASLAVAAVAEKERLGAVAIEDLDPELHRLLKTRPCLWVPALGEAGVVVGMENDFVSTLGMWLTRRLGGSPPLYTEIFTFDQQANCLLFGHAGMQDPALAGGNPITLVADAEYQASDEVEGAWMHFAARPGRVTAVSLFAAADNYRLAGFQGEVLPVEGAEGKLAGFAHALVRIERPLADFFRAAGGLGMSQHFALSYDEVAGGLEKLAHVLGLEWVQL